MLESLSDSFFASESSQKGKSACGTPVRHISNHCFRLICSFLLPLLFLFFVLPVSFGNIPIGFSCAPFPLGPPNPHHHPSPVLRAGGCSAITHHLVITGTKRALVACLQPLSAHRHWGKTTGKSPVYPDSLKSSSPPPQMMKTLSVWIRMERRALTRGITVIKAVPLHLCMSIPLSTYNVSLHTNFGIPSLSCCSLHCEAAVKSDFAQLSGLPTNLVIKVCMRVLRFSKTFNVIQVFQGSPRTVTPGGK